MPPLPLRPKSSRPMLAGSSTTARVAAKGSSPSPLHLGRWNVVRLGPGEAGLISSHKFLVRSAGLAMSRWDGGRGDLGQSADGGSSRTPLYTLRHPTRTSS